MITANETHETDWITRAEHASSLTTGKGRLDQLARDENWAVRQYVAGNPNTSASTLKTLEADENFVVRLKVKNRVHGAMFAPVS